MSAPSAKLGAENLQKIIIALAPAEAPDGITHESLWAYALGEDCYRLDNTPFYCYRYSLGDVVAAKPVNSGDLPTVQRVVSKSGHRTIRIAYEPTEQEVVKTTLEHLEHLGCAYEGAFGHLYALDLPPSVDLFAVRDILIAAELTWEHADPTYEELFPAEPED